MARVLVEQSFTEPLSDEAYAKLAERLDPCLAARNAAWRRSYVSVDRRRITCEFEAPDAGSVRESLDATGVPYDRVWSAEVFAVEDYPAVMKRLRELTGKER